MTGLPQESLKQLKFFISHLKSHPDLLHTSELSFFKEYLESLGAKLPQPQPQANTPPRPQQAQPEHKPQAQAPPPKHEEPKPQPKPTPKAEEKVEEMDTDVPEPAEPEDPHLWPADADFESLPLGDPAKQATDEEMDQANDLLSDARHLASREQNYAEAVQRLSKAISLNPTQSNLYAFRAEYLLAQKKPKAAIRDTNKALELNPDSSRALKIRGKAKRYLGIYLEAFYDLSQGNSLDWDESTVEIIKEISERAERAKQKQRKDDEKQRIEQLKREAAEKRRRQQEEEDRQQKQYPGGAGGAPGGGMHEGLNDLFGQLKDPEIQNLLKNNPNLIQKVVKAISGDMMAAQDPDVQKILSKLQASFGGGAGGFPHDEEEHEGHSHAGHDHSHAGHSHAGHSHAGHAHPHAHPPASKSTKDDDDLD